MTMASESGSPPWSQDDSYNHAGRPGAFPADMQARRRRLFGPAMPGPFCTCTFDHGRAAAQTSGAEARRNRRARRAPSAVRGPEPCAKGSLPACPASPLQDAAGESSAAPRFIISGFHDGSLIAWRASDGQRERQIEGAAAPSANKNGGKY